MKKKLFKNDDGTFKVLNVTLFSFILTTLILGLMCTPLLFQEKAKTYVPEHKTTNVQGQDIKICNNCDIEFYNKKTSLAVGEGIKVKDLIDLKDVDFANVKFTFSDDKYLSKRQIDGEYYFYANDIVGDVKITATYRDYKTEMTISIESNTIVSASFDKDIYYVYKGGSSLLDITTKPVGASISLLDLSSSDESILKFDSSNKAVGVSTGEAEVTLKVGEKETTAKVYVLVNMISVKAQIDGLYKEMDEYTHSSSAKTYNLYLAVKPEDNEKKGYTNEDISVSVKNEGSISGIVSFDSVYNAENNTYIYKVVLDFDSSKTSQYNRCVIKFSLPDGSVKYFTIKK